jgi:hypothetical protein
MACFMQVKHAVLEKLNEEEQCAVDDAIWDNTTKNDGFILDTGKLSLDLELKLMILGAEEKALKKLGLNK